MSTQNVPNSPGASGSANTFTVINATTIEYNGVRYEGVTDIAYPDGTHKTPTELLQAAGGQNLSASELKACVKVEAIDPDANGRQLFSVYSSNSAQTGKNVSSVVPGGVWVEVFDFKGDVGSNPILALWSKLLGGIDITGLYSPTWLGFKINYGTSERRAYTMTQLNAFGEESVPSPPVNIDVTIMHDVTVSGLFQAPVPLQTAAGEVHYVPMVNFRLYRANITSSGQFVYQRVPGEAIGVQYGLNAPPESQNTGAPFPGAVYVSYPRPFPVLNASQYLFGWELRDTSRADQLLEPLESLDWDAPPARELYGLTAWRNGMMVAYSKNLLYLFEPFRPFAAPQKYIKALPWNIVGMRADENSLVVITEGEPYIFNGTHPANVTYERLQNVQAGIKPTAISGYTNPTRALCRTPAGVVYASPDGLVLIGGGRAQLLMRGLMTREEWRRRYADMFGSLHLAYFDGHLIAYAETGVGFIVNLDGDPQLTEYLPDEAPSADFVLPQTDSLYLVTGNIISRFADELQPRRSGVYRTRDVIVPRPLNMGVLQLVGSGLVNAQVFADDQLRQSLTFVLDGGQSTQRLPGGFKARKWSVEFELVSADAVVSECYLAGVPLELAGA